jgi:hypothetical protein
MGAADSSMRNISQVETYAKSLDQVGRQVEQVFEKLRNQTEVADVKGLVAKRVLNHQSFQSN